MAAGEFPTLDPNESRPSRPNYDTGLLDQFNEAIRDPEQIGPYKIVRELGVGGMGSVYLAEQEHPVKRMVALKLIKIGMDTKEVLARFEAERQALAIMEHPNVARVLDAGATEQGRPYFVMEFVKGEPITTYCDRQNFTTRQRLELFAQVCEAIQHAHTKGIIHRDIKPSNVLVSMQSGEPLVKVIDFGVAKATNQRLTEKTLFTEVGQIVGTPEYMSPEQAEMSVMDIDTRSDIYSLGVLLYELLTGALPFEPKSLRSMAYAEMQRAIREMDPPRPSTRLSSLAHEHASEIAKKRKSKLDQLASELRNELEWIPLKAMRKDRAERYRTAAELADDVRNYLQAKPLIAGPESVSYRVRKFVRRNRMSVLVSSAVTFVVVTTILTSLVLITQARNNERRQREEAEKNLQRAEENFSVANSAVVDFFNRVREENLLNTPSLLPLQKKLLEDAVKYLAAFTVQSGNAPERIAELAQAHNTLGVVLTDLKQVAPAIESLAKSLEIRRQLMAQNPQVRKRRYDVASSLANLAAAYRLDNKIDQATAAYKEATTLLQALVAENSPSTPKYSIDLATIQRNVGTLLMDQQKFDEAAGAYELAINESNRLFTISPTEPRYLSEMANALLDQANAYGNAGKLEKSIKSLERARDAHRQLVKLTENDTNAMEALARDYAMLADKQLHTGDRAASDRSIKQAEEVWQALVDDKGHFGINPGLGRAYGTLAWTQLRLGENAAALESARRAVAADDTILWAKGNLGHAYLLNGQLEEAKKIYMEIKNQQTNPGETGGKMVREDFDLLTKAGIQVPHRAEIEAMLGQ